VRQFGGRVRLMRDVPNGGERGRRPVVEWYAGGRGDERPVAIRLGARRLVVWLVSSVVEADPIPGAPLRRVFVVRDESGRRYRITTRGRGPAVEVEAL
jgi:hypothetical protein